MATIVFIAVFGICVAMLWPEGLWSNAITVINVTISAALALNYFEPLATYMDANFKEYTYLFDGLALWGIFALSMMLLRTITNTISRHRVKFKLPVDLVGRGVLGAWVGYLMVGMLCLSLHVAALPTDMLGGGFQVTPDSNNFFGLGPDRGLLAFMHSRSEGALAGGGQFDPKAEFLVNYHQRRKTFRHRNEGRPAGEHPILVQRP